MLTKALEHYEVWNAFSNPTQLGLRNKVLTPFLLWHEECGAALFVEYTTAHGKELLEVCYEYRCSAYEQYASYVKEKLAEKRLQGLYAPAPTYFYDLVQWFGNAHLQNGDNGWISVLTRGDEEKYRLAEPVSLLERFDSVTTHQEKENILATIVAKKPELLLQLLNCSHLHDEFVFTSYSMRLHLRGRHASPTLRKVWEQLSREQFPDMGYVKWRFPGKYNYEFLVVEFQVKPQGHASVEAQVTEFFALLDTYVSHNVDEDVSLWVALAAKDSFAFSDY